MATIVNPTRMELSRLKKRLKVAVRGHKLLKDKCDEMVRQFIVLIRRNREMRMNVERALIESMGSFSRSKVNMGTKGVMEALFYPVKALEIQILTKNFMSVDVPRIVFKDSDEKIELPYGFVYSSPELDRAVVETADLLPFLIELAEVEKTCNLLAIEIERTRRRVNALEYVMIPKMQETIKYIIMKLEENDRAAIVRLMKAKSLIIKE